MKSTAKVIELKTRRKARLSSGGNGGGSKNGGAGLAMGKGFSRKAMKALAEAFSSPSDESGFRDRALFLVMSSTGLRSSEILSLTWSSKVSETETGKGVFKYIRKGGQICFTIPSPDALEAVREYHDRAGIQSDHWFFSLPINRNQGERSRLTDRSLRRIVNGWGVTTERGRKSHPHALRHTVGQRIFEEKGSIAAQKILGHTSPVTTAKYYTKPYFDGTDSLTWK